MLAHVWYTHLRSKSLCVALTKKVPFIISEPSGTVQNCPWTHPVTLKAIALCAETSFVWAGMASISSSVSLVYCSTAVVSSEASNRGSSVLKSKLTILSVTAQVQSNVVDLTSTNIWRLLLTFFIWKPETLPLSISIFCADPNKRSNSAAKVTRKARRKASRHKSRVHLETKSGLLVRNVVKSRC